MNANVSSASCRGANILVTGAGGCATLAARLRSGDPPGFWEFDFLKNIFSIRVYSSATTRAVIETALNLPFRLKEEGRFPEVTWMDKPKPANMCQKHCEREVAPQNRPCSKVLSAQHARSWTLPPAGGRSSRHSWHRPVPSPARPTRPACRK